jgi:hypothetical protein
MLKIVVALMLSIAQVWAGVAAATGTIVSPAMVAGPTSLFELPVIPSLETLDPRDETSIAVSPQNEQIIVGASKVIVGGASGHGATRVAYYFSSNGGRTWGNGVLPLETTEKTWGRASDPSVAADLDGNFYLCALMLDDSTGTFDSGVYVFKSTDHGQTFGNPVPVVVDTGHVSDPKEADKCYMSVDVSPSSPLKGAIYVVWRTTDPTRSAILISHRHSGETSFSAPRAISHSGDMLGPSVTTGPNGELYVAWTGRGNPNPVLFNASTDGGTTFLPLEAAPGGDFFTYGFVGSLTSPNPGYRVPGVPRMNSFPVMDVDRSNGPNRGMIYIAFAESRNRIDADVFVLRLTPPNGFRPHVSLPIRVNNDGIGADQFLPWLSVDPSNGAVNVAFYDRRDEGGLLMNLYNARSTDGGVSYSENTRVSGVRSDPTVQAGVLGSNNNQIGVGDYIAVAAIGGKTHLLWTDTRGGAQEIYYGQLDFGSSPPPPPPPGGGPANDTCASPRVIPSLPFLENLDTSSATSSADDPVSCSGAPDAASVWYSVTASSDTVLGIDTAGSDYDTVLSVYTGVCGSLAHVACSDDFGSSISPANRSVLTFAATAGATYLIEVSGKGSGGNLRLRLGYPTITEIEYTEGPDGSNSLMITGAGFINNDAVVTVNKSGEDNQLPTTFFSGLQQGDGTFTTIFGTKKKLKKLVKKRKAVIVRVESPAGSGRVSVPFSFTR